MNKRAQFFTILAILLIALMFISFEIFSTIRERQAIRTRVSTMNSFLHSIENNLERQMYISGFRIIFLAEDYITTTGNYINVDDFFEEGFFNGTVAGTSSDILIGATYNDLINSVNNKAAKINVEINMSNSNISVSQDDPWYVKFNLVSDFVMQDKSGLASWNKIQNISVLIPVVGFEDPIYTVNSNAKVSRKINQTIYEGNYTTWPDVSNLHDHVDKGYYTNNSDAPNFLMRLEGNFSADLNGIESFVNIKELENQGLSVDKTKSLIDHTYFNSPVAGNSVTNMQSWFKIDVGHEEKYQIP